ncbi:hypothetical protein RU86_GL000761 [Lactococcus piscium]|uniref:HTH marR-type domain-containing protein n=1 Tax=Pseudolactococcus piscium TaxID=1364 RepID=A0A2A5RWD6_9LACT|nr:MarR family transcriptional regulator [Lactococcus piscium]PCS05549.1 hypothetical protein RU86_GL000761 [Lactococcus piscium]
MVEKKIIYEDMLAYFEKLVEQVNTLEDVGIKTRYGKKLYRAEIHLLVKIDENPNQNMSELARTSNVTRGMISQLANKLERKGVLEKRKSLLNDRDILLQITEEGKYIIALHSQFHENLNRNFINYFSNLEVDQVDVILDFLKVTETFLDNTVKSQA